LGTYFTLFHIFVRVISNNRQKMTSQQLWWLIWGCGG